MKKIILIGIALVLAAGTWAQAQDVDFRNSYNSPHIYSPNGEYLATSIAINSTLEHFHNMWR